MKSYGLTGGIGSGKSTAGRIFSIAGIPVFQADISAMQLYTVPEVKKRVMDLLGEEAYTGEQINRKYVASLVFSQASLLQALNGIIHPEVMRAFEQWKAEHPSAPYVILEYAILFEAGLNEGFDGIICVYAPAGVCINRVMQRDLLSRKEVEQRMKNQMDPEEKAKLSDYLIMNDGERMLIPQVLAIHEILLKKEEK